MFNYDTCQTNVFSLKTVKVSCYCVDYQQCVIKEVGRLKGSLNAFARNGKLRLEAESVGAHRTLKAKKNACFVQH